uniref:Succinate dehydrogenase cytochrome b560 subunit, mitochondrial n=1 Tax=Chlamydomonas chlamydogama TaxID=225041 RepID=A0A7S2VUX9_9CHLO|mmetsp:Transcript_1354/g.2950  ORF Transcript_1354/g.2950 Transcript_1354/m.2950 type:complete len:206 (+) Transcript_1354:119-736(+)|eukprot:CAMPEP_0202902476 /NCGR_PEP_ID=MMETSP1392-20130828/16869_1 /ASSEMBLY_ACC=CAM_ASM_000868 /TAXON_ID=225041 /ORGANISM="Chlamydomonas chlamydogama, Strain SAG 11-48b" /LENGTH=205 /DNA_ID=CAMNT_0049589245 /DNA_START=115 /DNA_END=732 /DNA_ORIENTATION=-
MLRQSSQRILLQLLRNQAASSLQGAGAQAATNAQQFRGIGGDKIPEYWGRPSAYTEGTNFLGTPKNHLELINKRPLAPDVLEMDGKTPHYKMPWGALSSITNRVTGVALSVGFTGAGYIALTGNLPGLVQSIAATHPILLFPVKFAISYTLIYHYLGALRHFAWDHGKIGNQADKTSLLELPQVELSSKALFGASGALALIAAFM